MGEKKMDKVTVVKRELKEAWWAEQITACGNSGQSVSAWCRENGVSSKTYYYHLRKQREKTCEQIPVPIALFPSVHHGITIITIRSEGITVEIPSAVSTATLEAVIKALKC